MFTFRDTYRHAVYYSCRIPKLGGNDLDLHLLYKEVTSRGGLEQVFLPAIPISHRLLLGLLAFDLRQWVAVVLKLREVQFTQNYRSFKVVLLVQMCYR